MTIAETLKKLRIKKGMSQSDVCKVMNITQQRLSNWENGKAMPQSDTFLKLAKLYDVKDILEEFGFKDIDGGTIHPTYYELELIKKLRYLDSPLRDSIMQMVNYCYDLKINSSKETSKKKPTITEILDSEEPELLAAHGSENLDEEGLEHLHEDAKRGREIIKRKKTKNND